MRVSIDINKNYSNGDNILKIALLLKGLQAMEIISSYSFENNISSKSEKSEYTLDKIHAVLEQLERDSFIDDVPCGHLVFLKPEKIYNTESLSIETRITYALLDTPGITADPFDGNSMHRISNTSMYINDNGFASVETARKAIDKIGVNKLIEYSEKYKRNKLM